MMYTTLNLEVIWKLKKTYLYLAKSSLKYEGLYNPLEKQEKL